MTPEVPQVSRPPSTNAGRRMLTVFAPDHRLQEAHITGGMLLEYIHRIEADERSRVIAEIRERLEGVKLSGRALYFAISDILDAVEADRP